jgi:NitT/TauT family transport system ATP-binding protein
VAVILQVDIRRKQVVDREGMRAVIEGLRFSLEAGELVALVGPSGCGKSTLLRLIGGLDDRFDGRIEWSAGGKPVIGTVFQEPRLLPWRTVQQNLDLVRPANPALTADLLATLGLTAAAKLYPPALSLGMARRVAIARALAIEPQLLLLDEPFVSLDPSMAEQCRRLLLDAWRERGCAALLVTHDLAEAASLADRILLLSASPTRVEREVAIPESCRRLGLSAGARFAATLTR